MSPLVQPQLLNDALLEGSEHHERVGIAAAEEDVHGLGKHPIAEGRHRGVVQALGAVPVPGDDDHVIAIYKFEGKLGAIAKSNFTTLRFREPVYNNIRELGMSYFDFYFNSKGEKTLRELSELLDLSFFDKKSWQISKQEIDYITQKLDEMAHHQIASEKIIKNLNLVDKNLLEAGLLGSNPKGLFKI